MRNPASLAKRMAWDAAHPEATEARFAKVRAGHQRLQRDKPSKLEARLRAMLTEFGVVFEPSAMIKDKFVVDIRIGMLIIQADGDYWHGHPRFEPLTERQLAQQRRDRAQDAYLTTCGYTVVRVWESDMSRDKVATILREYDLISIA